MLITPCGRTRNSKGQPYTKKGLEDHIKACTERQCIAMCEVMEAEEEEGSDPLGILDDDMPDGAYWAMHHEIYGS